MDAELKSRWAKALRSGEYEQGKSFFEHEGKFCCLGVLCVVAGQPPVDKHQFGNWGFAHEAIPGFDITILASMNDDGDPFPKIADYIEATL